MAPSFVLRLVNSTSLFSFKPVPFFFVAGVGSGSNPIPSLYGIRLIGFHARCPGVSNARFIDDVRSYG